MPTALKQPGDVGFDWSQYGTYKRQAGDPVADAKRSLQSADTLQQSYPAGSTHGGPPKVGEKRVGATETVQWDGTQWYPVDADPVEKDATGKFFDSLLHTIDPRPIGHAIMHPIDTAHAYADNQARHPLQAAMGSMFPMTGGAGIEAGSRIGHGDIAGGAGQAVGDIANALIPVAAEEVPVRAMAGRLGRATSSIGHGVESFGKATSKAAPYAAMGEMMGGHPIGGMAAAAAPYAIEGSGRLTQKLGNALQGFAYNTEENAGRIPRGPGGSHTDNFQSRGSTTPPEGSPAPDKPPEWTPYEPPADTPEPHADTFQSRGEVDASTVQRPPALNQAEPPASLQALSDEPPATSAYASDRAAEMRSNLRPDDLSTQTPPDTLARINAERLRKMESSTNHTPRLVDQKFGPGTTDLAGNPAQAAPMKGDEGYIPNQDPAHLLYDPQTPTDYLREQLRTGAPDDPGRKWILKALDQRIKMSNRIKAATDGIQF